MKSLFNFLVLSLTITLSSCFNLSTLQTPKVLEKGEKTFGVGTLMYVDEEAFCCGIEAYARYAPFKIADIGIKLAGVPGFGTITGDVKFQLFSEPFYGALDLSYSHIFFSDIFNDQDESISQLTPALFFGTERIFGGAKMLFFSKSADDALSGDIFNSEIIGIFIGSSIGDQWKIMPVVNFYFHPEAEGLMIIPNLGLQYTF
jgi:hypothetical protein